MSKVYKKQFKGFMLALNKVLAGENSYYRFSKEKNSIFESYTFHYYWEENHDWDGGHLNNINYKLIYCVDESKLLIEYKFWWKTKHKEFIFYREVPVNYLAFNKDELFQLVFPFTQRKDYPYQMETDFDFGLDSFCKKSVMEQALMEDMNKDFE